MNERLKEIGYEKGDDCLYSLQIEISSHATGHGILPLHGGLSCTSSPERDCFGGQFAKKLVVPTGKPSQLGYAPAVNGNFDRACLFSIADQFVSDAMQAYFLDIGIRCFIQHLQKRAMQRTVGS